MTLKNAVLSVVAGAAMLSLSSCGGGWTDETKKQSKDLCITGMEIAYPNDAKSICDCYIDKLVAKYPKADFTPEQNSAIMDECSADAKKKAEEEANRKLEESLNAMEAAADSLGATTEEAH